MDQPENVVPLKTTTSAPGEWGGGDPNEGREGKSSPKSNVSVEPPTEAPPAESDPGGRAASDGRPDLSLEELRAVVEALLYASSDPLTLRELRKVLPEATPDQIKQALQELVAHYGAEGRGLQIMEVAGGYQIATRPEHHERVAELLESKPAPARLSIQALETLATIAYRQPITVPEIMELRGVRSAGVVRTLLERKLVRIVGRKKVVGRPLLYGTTKEFLLRFGLKSLRELPKLEDMAEVFGEDLAWASPHEPAVAGESVEGSEDVPGARGREVSDEQDAREKPDES
ncbi:MAG: SMC-Scp complex subunit ScpB [Acidobacteriota bacterium]